MYDHFSDIASSYRHVRITDEQPIHFIKARLKDWDSIKAADIGCGDGRYDVLLCQHLNDLHLTCIDVNERMLREAVACLTSNGVKRFVAARANVYELPLKEALLDCVFTFNAIHHFDCRTFIENAAGVTKDGGLLFIYTRFQGQNGRNIWGKYFPGFLDKEQRLYELDDIIASVELSNCSRIESIKEFKFKRTATLVELLERVRKKHYSTFFLYDDLELENCFQEFEKNIRTNFDNHNHIDWVDENTLIVLRLGSKCSMCS
jgi:ubiquinone/menaquinone biosynthesis C-methylase UbiE